MTNQYVGLEEVEARTTGWVRSRPTSSPFRSMLGVLQQNPQRWFRETKERSDQQLRNARLRLLKESGTGIPRDFTGVVVCRQEPSETTENKFHLVWLTDTTTNDPSIALASHCIFADGTNLAPAWSLLIRDGVVVPLSEWVLTGHGNLRRVSATGRKTKPEKTEEVNAAVEARETRQQEEFRAQVAAEEERLRNMSAGHTHPFHIGGTIDVLPG